MSDRDIYQRVAHLEEQATDLLARVRDLELVVATEARPRELTPEEAERDHRLRIMLDDIRRESQRRQQAAHESQEPAPAPGLAPENTPKPKGTYRARQRERLAAADWNLAMALHSPKPRTREAYVRAALLRLREWADKAGIDTPDLQFAPDPDWHLRTARVLIREELGNPRYSAVPVAIAHLKALLTTRGLLTVEPEPQATPDPDDLLARALEQVNCARDGDACAHVSLALGLLRQWQDATGVKTRTARIRNVMRPVDQLSSAAWAIEYGLRWAHERETCVANAVARLEWWQEQQPDDDESRLPMVTAIAHVRAALEPASDAPPAPDATQQAAPDELLTLALKHVDRARDGDACTVDRACPLVDRLGIDHCDREHVRQALDLLRQWQDAAGAEWRDLVLNTTQAHLSPSDQLRSAEINIRDAQQASDQGYRVALAIARLDEWLRREAQA